MNILHALKIEQNRLVRKLEGIKTAITALGGKRGKTKRKMSAATGRRISATQRKELGCEKEKGKMIEDEIQNADEIQIDTKLFKSWRKRLGYQYIGKSY